MAKKNEAINDDETVAAFIIAHYQTMTREKIQKEMRVGSRRYSRIWGKLCDSGRVDITKRIDRAEYMRAKMHKITMSDKELLDYVESKNETQADIAKEFGVSESVLSRRLQLARKNLGVSKKSKNRSSFDSDTMSRSMYWLTRKWA